MKTTILFLLLFVFYSCEAQNLTKINGFPEEIEGCSCYFSESKEDFNNNKYIYLDQYYSGLAFISIDGKLIQIDLEVEAKTDYTVEIEFDKEFQNGDETFWKTGTIKVKLKDGTILSKKFVGECGC
ncbi:MAG: hypothetical protein ACSHXL_02705 [Bacteroidota bacterium]